MSDFYKKNIAVLRERFKDIAEYIENKEYFASENLYIEEFDGQKKLLVKEADRYLQISSLYDDDLLAGLWVKNHMMEECFEGKYLIFGFGTGVFVRKFLKEANQSIKLIVFEPDDIIFERVIREYDVSDILENDRLLFYLKPILKNDARFSFGQFLSYADIFNTKIGCYPNYEVMYCDEYQAMCEEVNAAGRAVDANQFYYENLGKECNENIFNNIKYYINSKSLDKIKNKMPDDYPAIVVAGGPSLDKNIEELKKVKNRALIVATDTALRPLARVGVIPDIAIAVDPIKGEKYFSEEESRKVPLVCGLQTSYKVLNSHKAIKMFRIEYSTHMNDFLEKEGVTLPVLESGGSVANDAMSLALYLGAKTIILIGQDLAYTGDKTHSNATVEGEEGKNEFYAETFDVDIYGNEIRTSLQFLLYRDWIEKIIREDKVGTKYIDATEGGILIRGTKIMTLAEAINQYCDKEYDFRSCFAEAEDVFDKEQKRSLKAYYNMLPNDIEEIGTWVNKCIQIYNRMLDLIVKDKYHSNEMAKLSQKSKELLEKINNSSSAEYIFNIVQGKMNNVLKRINTIESNERDELITVCNYGRDSLVEMKKAISLVMPQVKKAMKEIENE